MEKQYPKKEIERIILQRDVNEVLLVTLLRNLELEGQQIFDKYCTGQYVEWYETKKKRFILQQAKEIAAKQDEEYAINQKKLTHEKT